MRPALTYEPTLNIAPKDTPMRAISLSTAALLATAALSIGLAGCKHSHHHAAKGDAVAVAVVGPSGAATTRPTMNNVRGTVTFTQVGGEVLVHADVTGLPPNSTHGFHLHEKGDLSAPDLMSTGPHWDPEGHGHHGGPHQEGVHAGDFGNLVSDATGRAVYTARKKGFSLTGEPSAIGRAVIIHANADDLKSQPAGAAGARIAGGVVVKKN